eukprot:gb/GECG01012952.1/.p1 GENE.gb/GECG01012952.1/~~gb/GECG01012952.1/.p1  ORF type:complete len:259 (+),score=19.12 gb/GECG01012952.1/:1-777(+)
MRKSLKGGRHGRAPSMGGSSSPTPLSAHLPMASRRRRDDDEPDHPHLDAMVFRSSSLNPNTRKEDLGNFTGEKTRKKKTRSSCMARVCGGRKWEENARIVNQTLLLQREMRRVSDWYPGSYFIAIIGPTGKVWAVVNDSDRSNYHLLYPIASVKNSSLELSNQMVQNDCAAIHIKGSQHLLTMLSFGPEKKYVRFCTPKCLFIYALVYKVSVTADFGPLQPNESQRAQRLRCVNSRPMRSVSLGSNIYGPCTVTVLQG